MNKRQLSSNQQRVGKLVEEYVCKTMGLRPNKRQHKIGYYDAFDMDTIYEIKAINSKDNRATIDMKNHKQLLLSKGSYIFVRYQLINKDKELSVITDIKIIDVQKLESVEIDHIIVRHGSFYTRNYRGKQKEYVRITWNTIKGDKNDN